MGIFNQHSQIQPVSTPPQKSKVEVAIVAYLQAQMEKEGEFAEFAANKGKLAPLELLRMYRFAIEWYPLRK